MADTDGKGWLGFGGFRARMASGVLVMIPIVVTVLVLRLMFSFTAGMLLPIVGPATEDWPWSWRAALAVAILLAAVYVLGALATHVLGRRVLSVGEAVVLRVPFVKLVYSASKQVVSALESQSSGAFKAVVLVEFPRAGMRSVGFITSTLESDGVPTSTIFVPTSPNPTSGFLLFVPSADLTRTALTVEQGIKMVMSAGVLAPDNLPLAT